MEPWRTKAVDSPRILPKPIEQNGHEPNERKWVREIFRIKKNRRMTRLGCVNIESNSGKPDKNNAGTAKRNLMGHDGGIHWNVDVLLAWKRCVLLFERAALLEFPSRTRDLSVSTTSFPPSLSFLLWTSCDSPPLQRTSCWQRYDGLLLLRRYTESNRWSRSTLAALPSSVVRQTEKP